MAFVLVAGCAGPGTARLRAADAVPSEADKAWEAIEQAGAPPQVPTEWQTAQPSREVILKFRAEQSQRLSEASVKAKDFYTKYPDHAKAEEARQKEYELVVIAVRLGNTNLVERVEVLEAARLKDPKLDEEERFELRTRAIQRAAEKKMPEGQAAAMAEYEKGVRELMKEFPKRPEPFVMLVQLAGEFPPDKARAAVKEVLDSPAPDEVKAEAQNVIKKLDALGKPVELKFKAVDGRDVDLAALKGKVVLLDFWATWCGPCVKELPKVIAAYDKLHPQGFEIVGLSFDKDKDALISFVAEKKMAWPQYFDGQGWENKYGKQFGITSIPTMWLVNKKGVLVDMSAREGLMDKVEKLLAE